jgi:hypothetical protein
VSAADEKKVRGASTGSQLLSFDDGFDHAQRLLAIEEALKGPCGPVVRAKLEREAQRLGNKLTPPARQAAASFRRIVVAEVMRWVADNDGMPNITTFVSHVQKGPEVRRIYRGTGTAITPGSSAIRKIVSSMGIRGRRGKPPKNS